MTMSSGRFSGKRAVITGASSGIGRATAKRFVAEGGKVALIARGQERLQQVAAEIGTPDAVLVVPADCTDEASITAAVDQAAAKLHRIACRQIARRDNPAAYWWPPQRAGSLAGRKHRHGPCTAFAGFGGFLSAAARENDYLWGRLHAAERLVGIVASAVGGPGAPDAFELRGFRKRAFEAILEEEASRLRAVPELIARLRAAVAAL